MKFGQFGLLGAALLLSTRLFAAEGVIPTAVAESESFEVVGRLKDEGLVFYIDRSDSNAPVLGAVLEVESAGKSVKAIFRAERGDYLVADAEWLQSLRQPGEYPLGLTLIAGDESDLLSASLEVPANAVAAGVIADWGWFGKGGAGLAGLLGLFALSRFRKGART